MIYQKFSRHHATAKFAALGLAVFTQLHATEAQSQSLDHAEVVKVVVSKAPYTLPGAEHMRFTVERIEMPRSERKVGFVCGKLISTGNSEVGVTMQSYQALLFEKGGAVAAGPVVGFFKPVEQLLQDEMCQ
ncbi:hypothetical protein [Phyllobacterium sp. 22552]|uniref:hypothetical protein n=1 Tax=Phyllobacterium sp. 22552 TaxID=3453941 RepID=UPI003F86AEA3